MYKHQMETERVRMRITMTRNTVELKWRADGKKNSETPNQLFFNRLLKEENNSYNAR